MTADSSEFAKAVLEAFKCGPALHRGQILVGSSHDPEFVAIANRLAGKRWTEVTLQSLCDNRSYDINILVAVLSDAAFFYFLPAFLIIVHQSDGSRWEAEAIAGGIVNRFIKYLKTPDVLTGKLSDAQASLVQPLIEKELGSSSPKKVAQIKAAFKCVN